MERLTRSTWLSVTDRQNVPLIRKARLWSEPDAEPNLRKFLRKLVIFVN